MTAQPSPIARYEEVLARAVAALPLDVNERYATYDRARAALTTRLRSASPPLPEAAIASEQTALEAAIERVEMRFADSSIGHSEPLPATVHKLNGRRRGAIVALVCCTAIILALLVGFFSFKHGRDIENAAYQGLRQAMTRPNESPGSKQNADTPSGTSIPYVFMRQLVHYRSTNPAGTVVIDKAQRYLYVILANVTAVRYGIALGGACVEAAGRYAVSRKSTDRALYLDSDTHLIHGTNASGSIGRSVSLGCFQLIATDLAELYGRVPVGTRVVVN